MSRINDALKRAKRSQNNNPPPGLTPLPPVASRPDSVIGWILPGVIGFLIVAACLFIGMALVSRTATKAAGKPGLLATQPANPATMPAPIPASIPVSNAPPPTPPPAPPPPPPEPKLQGIVYTTTQPWAIVDGQTFHVGDPLGEYRVREISQHSVTLEKADGSRKKLGLAK